MSGSPTRLMTSCWHRQPASQDPAEQACLFDEAEAILQKEAPIAPIYQYTNAWPSLPWLKGYPITGRLAFQPSALPRQTLSPGGRDI